MKISKDLIERILIQSFHDKNTKLKESDKSDILQSIQDYLDIFTNELIERAKANKQGDGELDEKDIEKIIGLLLLDMSI